MTLFDPITFRSGITLRNKLVLAPMTTYASNDDLTLSKEEETYYHSRAKDLGMVITAATAVSKQAQAFPNQISIQDDSYIDSMSRLARSIQSNGSVAILQLHHGGRMNQPNLFEGQDIVAPSGIKANREYAVTPRELSVPEIKQLIEEFKQATRRAIQAGFDGVELHGANTYLLQQFFSPHSNRRIDEYGGSRSKRYTFIHELIQGVKQVIKDEATNPFALGYRFSPEEIEEPGITLNDTKYLVDRLSQEELDYLHISLGTYQGTSMRDPLDTTPIVQSLVEVIDGRVPFIGVGGIETLDQANEALKMGYDLVALGLITLGDTDVVAKLKDGKEPSKVISKNSMLPDKMYQRLLNWNLSTRGYIVK